MSTTPAGRGIAMVILVFASFVDLLDATVAQVALRPIQESLGASPGQLEWIPTGYLLAFAVLLVTGGRLGDAIGRRDAFLLGMGGFTLASLGAAVAPTATVLIAARLLQGAFAGVMVPQAISTLQALYAPEERAPMLGIFGAVAGLAAMVGPVLGGGLVSADLPGLGWRAVFLINVPVGIALFVLAQRLVPNTRSTAPVGFAPLSLALSAAGVFLVLYGLIEGRRLRWDATIWLLLGTGGILLAAFAVRQCALERAQVAPLVPMSLFRDAGFSIGLVTQTCFQGAMNAFTVIFFLYVQAGLGFSAIAAGLTVLPFSIGAVVGTTVSVPLGARYGKVLMSLGALMQAVGVLWIRQVVHDQGTGLTGWDTLVPFAVMGVGLGLLVVPLVDVALARVPIDAAGAATGTYNTFQQVGAALGIAAVGLVFFRHTTSAGLPIHLESAFRDGASVAAIGYAVAAVASLWLPGGHVAVLEREATEVVHD